MNSKPIIKPRNNKLEALSKKSLSRIKGGTIPPPMPTGPGGGGKTTD